MKADQEGHLAVLAVGAHPDDVEFMMAGTLAMLKRAGADVHIWSMTDGSLGSMTEGREKTARTRMEEGRLSASLIGATLHRPIAGDMRLIYNSECLARAGAVIRDVRPTIMLVPSPCDYHPDHENASRLAVAAALARALPGFVTDPSVSPWAGDVTIYHALPHGLRDQLRARVIAGQYVDIMDVMELKRQMLRAHASQADLLLATQGVEAIETMEQTAAETGSASGSFAFAEGWRRHLHVGLSSEEVDPLGALLGRSCWRDPQYEASLG